MKRTTCQRFCAAVAVIFFAGACSPGATLTTHRTTDVRAQDSAGGGLEVRIEAEQDTVQVGSSVFYRAVAGRADSLRFVWYEDDSLATEGPIFARIYTTPGPRVIRVEVRGRAVAGSAQRNLEVVDAGGALRNSRHQAPEILEVYGKRVLREGELANYRVRIAPEAIRPVRYRWHVTGGAVAEGNTVTFQFDVPGEYQIVIQAENVRGSDMDTLTVRVGESQPVDSTNLSASEQRVTDRGSAGGPNRQESTVLNSSLYSPLPVDVLKGGYTWVVATFLDAFPAEQIAQQYRSRGYRSAVFEDDAPAGSTAYRVVIGQFATDRQALTVRERLLKETKNNIWLLRLPSSQ